MSNLSEEDLEKRIRQLEKEVYGGMQSNSAPTPKDFTYPDTIVGAESPHGNDAHEPAFSEEAHDHSGESVNPESVDTGDVTVSDTLTRAKMSADTVVPSAETVRIPFDTVLVDELDGFDTNANEFEVQQGGRYAISLRVMFQSWSGDSRLDLFLSVAGGQGAENWHTPGTHPGFTTATLTTMTDLSPGNLIFAEVRQTTGSEQTLDQALKRTGLEISRLG